jgi:hypothetical protein
VRTKRKAISITLTLVALGYTGAAISFSYLVGLNLNFPYLCPLCPEIFTIGMPLAHFLWLTLLFGTANAALLATAGWALIGLVLGLKRLLSV